MNNHPGVQTIEKRLWIEALSFIVPREILEDGFDPETRRILVELSIATLIMTMVMLPNFCFKTKY